MIILSGLSEVLINGVDKVDEVIAKRYGKEYGVLYAERFNQTKEVFHDLLRGRLTEDRYFDILMGDDYWPFEPGHLEWIYTEEFRERIPDTFGVYKRISACPRSFTDHTMEDGIPSIVVVSDHISEHTWEIEYFHADIFGLTWEPIWSCKLGMIKSDPGFFPNLLEIIEFEPEECLFIDDKAVNIAAAEAAGIRSVQFHDAYQLEAELTNLGFEFYA